MEVQWFDRSSLDRVIKDYINVVDVVLDIGCGIKPQVFFKPQLHIFCEPHSEYVKIINSYFEGQSRVIVLEARAQEVTKLFPDRTIDSIFLLDLIEHLDKDEANKLLAECERIAREQVIIFTPLGFVPQDYDASELDAWGFYGGEWQSHRSGWTPNDFDDSWKILACRDYHKVNSSGELLDPPEGAFWAIKDIQSKGEKTLNKNKPLDVKLALVSHSLPPSSSRQAVVLYQLLDSLRPSEYCVISSANYSHYEYLFNSETRVLPQYPSRLPVHYYHLQDGVQIGRATNNGINSVLRLLNALFRILNRVRLIVEVIKKENCDVIMACSGDLYDLPVAMLASRWLQIPFYAYMFDDYAYESAKFLHIRLAKLAEYVFLKQAKGIIVSNELLREEYRHRHNVVCKVIHNPCEAINFSKDNSGTWPKYNDEIRIIYTGVIPHSHFDEFRNLIKAIKLCTVKRLSLHVYTYQPRYLLERESICGPVVFHSQLSAEATRRIHQEADILFLPQEFNPPIPELNRTSSPQKISEYLTSGRPIIVYAPADTFVSSYFREQLCGIVVDHNDPFLLAEAIQQIVTNESLRRTITDNAASCAYKDFNLNEAQHDFRALIEF